MKQSTEITLKITTIVIWASVIIAMLSLASCTSGRSTNVYGNPSTDSCEAYY